MKTINAYAKSNPEFATYLKSQHPSFTDAIKKACANKDWQSLLILMDSQYRLEMFYAIKQHLSDEMYWQELGDTLTHTDYMFKKDGMIRELLSSNRPNRHLMMSEVERLQFAALPEELTVYRGCGSLNQEGFSWTLSKERARSFANRSTEEKSLLLTGICKKADAIAHFTERTEDEILILPENVQATKKVPVTNKSAKLRRAILMIQHTPMDMSKAIPWDGKIKSLRTTANA